MASVFLKKDKLSLSKFISDKQLQKTLFKISTEIRIEKIIIISLSKISFVQENNCNATITAKIYKNTKQIEN